MWFVYSTLTTFYSSSYKVGFNEKDNLGLELFLPKIFFCSSFNLFSWSFFNLCLSSSIFLCSSTIASLSSACKNSIFLIYFRKTSFKLLKCILFVILKLKTNQFQSKIQLLWFVNNYLHYENSPVSYENNNIGSCQQWILYKNKKPHKYALKTK